MGAWGVKALDSDDGLDVIEFLTENYLPEHTTLKMEDLISAVKEEGFFGDILALIELYFEISLSYSEWSARQGQWTKNGRMGRMDR